jgi:hypothetical protein
VLAAHGNVYVLSEKDAPESHDVLACSEADFVDTVCKPVLVHSSSSRVTAVKSDLGHIFIANSAGAIVRVAR